MRRLLLTVLLVLAPALALAQASGGCPNRPLRALAVTTAKRAPMLPEVPTLAETVAPGIDTSLWQGLLVAAATPAQIVALIQRDVAAALAQADVADRLGSLGMVVAPSGPEPFGRFMREEIETWRRVARAAGVQPE